MEALIETFHIDIQLLIAQVVNFVIVLLVLWFFALKPLIKIMNDRSAKIEKSLEEAKNIEVRHAESVREAEQVVDKAKKESGSILEEAKKEAELQKKDMIDKAKAEIEKLISQNKEQIADEKDQMMKEVRSEVATLVSDATKKVLTETVDTQIDEKIIEKSIKELS